MDSDDDRYLRDAFLDARDMDIPSGLKARCIAAAQDGLASVPSSESLKLTQETSQTLRLLIAVAASLLIGVSLGWVLRGQTTKIADSIQTPAKPQVKLFVPAANANATSVVEYEKGGSGRSFFVKETYLCGVGRIESRSNYRIDGDQE